MSAPAPVTTMPLDAGPADPVLPLEQAVRAAFAAALQTEDFGQDDDFFDLGGDSILAVTLFLELRRLTGRECPVATIYDAPTPRALAACLACEGPQPFSCLVTLRQAAPGCTLPPLFLIHGIDGVVVALSDLAHMIGDGRAVHALQARGLAPDATGQADSVQAMAAEYLPEIRRVAPHGPYALAGYSFGGLVAFEIACLLQAEGETIAHLILLDTLCHQRSWPLDARLYTSARLAPAYFSPRALGRSATYYRRRLKEMGPAYLLRGLRRAAAAPFDITHAGFVTRMAAADHAYGRPEDLPMLPAMRRVRVALEQAYRTYEPEFFDGMIDFIKASEEDFLPYAARAIWRRHARGLRLAVVRSGHMSLVRENVALVAPRVTAILARGDGHAG